VLSSLLTSLFTSLLTFLLSTLHCIDARKHLFCRTDRQVKCAFGTDFKGKVRTMLMLLLVLLLALLLALLPVLLPVLLRLQVLTSLLQVTFLFLQPAAGLTFRKLRWWEGVNFQIACLVLISLTFGGCGALWTLIQSSVVEEVALEGAGPEFAAAQESSVNIPQVLASRVLQLCCAVNGGFIVLAILYVPYAGRRQWADEWFMHGPSRYVRFLLWLPLLGAILAKVRTA